MPCQPQANLGRSRVDQRVRCEAPSPSLHLCFISQDAFWTALQSDTKKGPKPRRVAFPQCRMYRHCASWEPGCRGLLFPAQPPELASGQHEEQLLLKIQTCCDFGDNPKPRPLQTKGARQTATKLREEKAAEQSGRWCYYRFRWEAEADVTC